MTPDEIARLRQLRATATDHTRDPAERIAAATEGAELALGVINRDVGQRITTLETIVSALTGSQS